MKNLSVLLVEDNEALKSLYTIMLEDYGYSVTPVTGATRAIKELEHSNFDILITDHRISDLSGLELVQYVRTTAKKSFLPIVAISAFDTPNIARDFLLAGADRFLLKPIARKDLLNEITRAIEHQQDLKKRLTNK